MLVLGHFHLTPERVPCIVLQAQLPVFRTGIKTQLVMGNAVCGNTCCCTTGRSYKYTCLHNTLVWGTELSRLAHLL